MTNEELKSLQKQITANIKFFIGENDDVLYAKYFMHNHYETYPVYSERFIAYLDSELRNRTNKWDTADWNEILKVKRQEALNFYNFADVYRRTANDSKNVWYFLADKDWSCVHATKSGWTVTTNYEPIFSKNSNTKAQVIPVSKKGADRLKKYANLNKDDYKLFKINLIHGFFYKSSHYMVIFDSDFDSGKTTLVRVVRRIVDPAKYEFTSLSSNIDDFKAQLVNNSIVMLDNTARLNAEFSNLISGAVSGSSVSKRKLYTDFCEIVQAVKCVFYITGIDIVPKKQDLISRCLLFKPQKISEKNRRTEEDFWESFNNDLPYILGDIFNIISKSLEILETLGTVKCGRMADANREMLAIALAMGMTKNEFYKLLEENKQRLNLACARNHEIVTSIQDYMESTGKDCIEGDVSDIYNSIRDFHKGNLRGLPKSPSAFSRALNQKSQLLLASGIRFTLKKKKNSTFLTLNYNPV